MCLRTMLCMLLAFLIIQLVTLCGGEELRVHPGERMWTEPDQPVAGEPFDVFCSYNEYNKEERKKVRISMYDFIKNQSNDVLTVRVTDTTGRHSVTRNPPGKFNVFDFECYVQDELVWHLKRWVAPVPDLKDFVCLWEESSDTLECTFGQLGEEVYWNYITYFLIINDSDQRVKCKQTTHNKKRIQCDCNDFPRTYLTENWSDNNSYNFKLIVRFNEIEQIQEFNFSRQQIEVPKWTINVIGGVTWQKNLACLTFDYNMPDRNPGEYRWRVLLQPIHPQLKAREPKVHAAESKQEDICFDYPHYGNQDYELSLWRRFDYPDSPWTSTYLFLYPFTTRATVPDRPPQLLPNGFHYDREKAELYVYWKPLDEVEFGSTEFHYKASTESGLESLELGDHSAYIRKWDSTQPTTVTIWSENNEGRSVNSSHIMVPVLTDAERRQSREVWSHINNNTVTWRPPIEKHNLIGYIFFWCLIFSDTSGACNDLEFIELDGSQELFQFNKSIAPYRTAVAAKYRENISGGMIWSSPKPILINTNYSTTHMVVMLFFALISTFALSIIFSNIFRLIRAMTQITVELPDFLIVPQNSATGLKTENFVNLKPNQGPIMGHISPNHMNIVLVKNVEELMQKRTTLYDVTEDPKSKDTNIETTPNLRLLTYSVQYTFMGSSAVPENFH